VAKQRTWDPERRRGGWVLGKEAALSALIRGGACRSRSKEVSLLVRITDVGALAWMGYQGGVSKCPQLSQSQRVTIGNGGCVVIGKEGPVHE